MYMSHYHALRIAQKRRVVRNNITWNLLNGFSRAIKVECEKEENKEKPKTLSLSKRNK